MEAIRFTISDGNAAGADILRIPNNILQLRHSNGNVLSVGMKEWYKNQKETIFKVLDFLFDGNQFSEEIKSEILNEVKRKMKRALEGNHITKNKISDQEKERMKMISKNDAIIRPILKSLSKIVQEELEMN